MLCWFICRNSDEGDDDEEEDEEDDDDESEDETGTNIIMVRYWEM